MVRAKMDRTDSIIFYVTWIGLFSTPSSSAERRCDATSHSDGPL